MMKYLPIAGIVLFAVFAVIMGARLGQDEIKIKDLSTTINTDAQHVNDLAAKLKAFMEEKPAKKGDKK